MHTLAPSTTVVELPAAYPPLRGSVRAYWPCCACCHSHGPIVMGSLGHLPGRLCSCRRAQRRRSSSPSCSGSTAGGSAATASAPPTTWPTWAPTASVDSSEGACGGGRGRGAASGRHPLRRNHPWCVPRPSRAAASRAARPHAHLRVSSRPLGTDVAHTRLEMRTARASPTSRPRAARQVVDARGRGPSVQWPGQAAGPQLEPPRWRSVRPEVEASIKNVLCVPNLSSKLTLSCQQRHFEPQDGFSRPLSIPNLSVLRPLNLLQSHGQQDRDSVADPLLAAFAPVRLPKGRRDHQLLMSSRGGCRPCRRPSPVPMGGLIFLVIMLFSSG